MTRRKELGPPPERVNHLKRITEHLVKNGPGTVAYIAESLGLPNLTVRNAIAKQRSAYPNETFPIVEWRPGTLANTHVAVYAYGRGEDVWRPEGRGTRKAKPVVVDMTVRVEPLKVPYTEYRTKFINDINPWTGQPA